MWAQLITIRVKSGRDDEIFSFEKQLLALEQPDSGLVSSTMLRDQKDPSRFFILVVFESEEKARERENDPRREQGLQALRATMMDFIEGPPEFVDLLVLDSH